MEADDIISSAIEKCTANDNRDKYELALESKRDCVQAKLEIVLCSTPKTDIVGLNSRTRQNFLADFYPDSLRFTEFKNPKIPEIQPSNSY